MASDGRLHLMVNEAKSAVASVFGRKFLGYAFRRAGGVVKRRVASKAIKAFKERIRELTPRVTGRSLKAVAERLPHLRARMESLLPAGANTVGLASAGRVNAPSSKGRPTQAMETRRDDLPGTDGKRSEARCGAAGGGKLPSLGATAPSSSTPSSRSNGQTNSECPDSRKPQSQEPPGADPHAGWCGRGAITSIAPFADWPIESDVGPFMFCKPEARLCRKSCERQIHRRSDQAAESFFTLSQSTCTPRLVPAGILTQPSL
uniref:Riorf24 protein n=1 Tax=Rhizobium rhizogenes TaxID=359 RepID=Q9F5G8_RHIRH|nr:riorf24 [Rhizobium rhizogenes]